MNLDDIRDDYSQTLFDEQSADADPQQQAQQWLAKAEKAEMPLHNSMALSTLDASGYPQSRIVLLKAISDQGFEFFTNIESDKARELSAHKKVSALFFWPQLERQFRVSGICVSLPRARAEEYFHSRPRKSQISAWCSAQSRVVASREILEQSWREYEEHFVDQEIPLPDFWGGYCIEVESYEFWQGRASRLHDRIAYNKENGQWVKCRLAP